MLIAVLVIVGSALLVATSVVFIAQTEAAGAAGSAQAAQARALAWSGLQAVMSRLNEQRDIILQGDVPAIDSQYVIYEAPGRLGIARLLPMRSGELLVPEPGKLDVNRIDAVALAKTGLVDPALAAAIIAHRDSLGRALQSVGELLDVADVTPELLWGPIDEMRVMEQARNERESLPERMAQRLEGESARALANVLTVFSFEPALQQNGKLRINLNVKWSEELERRVEDRFGRDSANLLKQIFESGATFENEAKIIQTMRFFNTPPEDWPEILDTFTTDEGEVHFGRLDINTASYAALLALPEITPEQAARMISLREELSPQERATIAWPVMTQALPPEMYDQLAGRITTRSWLYRLRLAAGEVDAVEPEGELLNPVIHEVVIDLSDPRPRVAYLREITLLETAAQIAREATLLQPPDFAASEADERAAADGTRRGAVSGPPSGSPAPLVGPALPAHPAPAGPPEANRSAVPPSDAEAGPADHPPGNGPKPTDRKIGRWIGGG